MIGRWDERKGLNQQYEANTKDFLLRRLAFQMHVARARSISLHAVSELFESELKKRGLDIDGERVFQEIVHRSGLLRTDGNVVEWRHHLLQEYFAGRGVPNSQFFRSVAQDEWWRTPMVFHFGDDPEAFVELWDVVETAKALSPAEQFDAAITLGLAVQACYLAELPQKTKTLAWVLQSFSKTMDDFRRAIDLREGGGKAMMSLCAMLALGRDAIATKTLQHVTSEDVESADRADALFKPVDPDRILSWRIIGLLEAAELETAADLLEHFRPVDRDLIFMVHLSVAWIVYIQDVRGEVRKRLDGYLNKTRPLIDDMRQALFKEFRTLFFNVRSGKVTPVLPSSEQESE